MAARIDGRAGRRAVAVIAVAAALAGLLGQSVGFGQEQDLPLPPGDGRTDVVSGPAVGVAGPGAGAQPDVSADAGTVVFASRSALLGDTRGADAPTLSRIFARDNRAGTLALLARGEADHAAPSVSGDGRLVAYSSTRPLRVRGQESREVTSGGSADAGGGVVSDLWVTDRTDPAQPVTRRVSGVSGDLPYQRIAACVAPAAGVPDSGCGPQLSTDGRTLVFPARQSVSSPHLSLYTLDGEKRRDLVDEQGRELALLDLGSADEPAAVLQRTVHIAVRGPEAVPFGAPEVDGPFRIVPGESTCGDATAAGATVEPGFTCRIQVAFDAATTGCDGLAHLGSLALTSPVPAGQAAISLVADAPARGCGAAPAAAPRAAAAVDRPRTRAAADLEGCAGPRTVRRGPALSEQGRGSGTGTLNLGEADLGDSTVVAVRINNILAARDSASRLSFAATDCSMRLVVPDEAPAQNPPPCRPEPKPARAGSASVPLELGDLVRTEVTIPPDARDCTAYLRFAPTDVGAALATLTLLPRRGELRGAPVRYRFVGTGAADLAVLRHDAGGRGEFVAADRPARVISRDSRGVAIEGTEPSLSGDGRYVAFTSRQGHPAGRSRQVLLHQVDAAGDGTFRPGATVVVSAVPAPGGDKLALPAAAGRPAVSGDGGSVAFEALLTSTQASRKECRNDCRQVFVHDREQARTVGVSMAVSAVSSPYGNADSRSPAISADGSTVAYVSTATDLLPFARPEPGVPRVYVRDLGPDRGGPGTRRNEPVPSGEAFSDAGRPALNADGGSVAFQAVQEPPADASQADPQDAPGPTQVLLRSRYGRALVSPAQLSFGDQEIDTRSPVQVITVTNAGPGPLAVRANPDGPFTVVNGCAGRALHRDESCLVQVVFVPGELGAATGTVTVLTTSAGAVNQESVVALAGAAVPQVLAVRPGKLDLPGQGVGRRSEPLDVVVENVGDIPVGVRGVTADDGEFPLVGGTCADRLAPGAQCTLRLVFRPAGLGERLGELTVIGTRPDGSTLQRILPARGTTLEPALRLDPAVTRLGRVVTLLGEHFAPDTAVQVTSPVDGALVTRVRTLADGTFRAPVVVHDGHPLGPWALAATADLTGTVDAPTLLVTAGTFQPPGFTERR